MKRFLCASIFKTVTTLLLIILLFIPCISVVGVTHHGGKHGTYADDMDGKMYHVMSIDDAEEWYQSEEYRYVRLANLNRELHLDVSRNEGLGRDDLELLSLVQVYSQADEEMDRLTELFQEVKEAQDKIDDLNISDDDKDALKSMASVSVASNAEESLGVAFMTLIAWIAGVSLFWRLIDGITGIITAVQGLTVGVKAKDIEKFETYIRRKTRRSFYKPVWSMLALILYLAGYGIAMQGTYAAAMANSKFLSMYTGLAGYRVLVEPFLNPFVWLLVALAVGILTHILVNRLVQDDIILYRDET